MYIKIQLIFLAVILGELKAQEKRNYRIELIHTSASHNASSFIKELNCLLRSQGPNQTRNGIDCYMILAEVLNSFDINVAVNCYPKNMRRWTLLNIRTNGCEFFGNLQRHKVFRVFVETIKTYLNVDNFKCPLKKDFNYTVTGFKYDESKFPTYVPAGEYVGILDFISQKKLLGSITVRGVVKYYDNKKG
ncbi:uncharacterized protein ACRADG_004014 [Cochliomyia hominivorax]